MERDLPQEISILLDDFQRNEITENLIYINLAEREKDAKNRDILEKIAEDELRHYNAIKEITGRDFEPDKARVGWYTMMARVFGLTFTIKLMEKRENRAQSGYSEIKEKLKGGSPFCHGSVVFRRSIID